MRRLTAVALTLALLAAVDAEVGEAEIVDENDEEVRRALGSDR